MTPDLSSEWSLISKKETVVAVIRPPFWKFWDREPKFVSRTFIVSFYLKNNTTDNAILLQSPRLEVLP